MAICEAPISRFCLQYISGYAGWSNSRLGYTASSTRDGALDFR